MLLSNEEDGDLVYEMTSEDWAEIESAIEWECSTQCQILREEMDNDYFNRY